jgi:hypothetical protein
MRLTLHILQQEKTTYIEHLNNFKIKHLLYLKILEVLSINKFSSQFQNLLKSEESAWQRNLMEHDINFEVLSIRFDLYSSYNLDNIQQEHFKLVSLELCYLKQYYHGLHHYWRRTLFFLKI